MKVLACLVALTLPGLAAAQTPPPATDYDDRIIDACLSEHWGGQNARESCIGVAARACMPVGEGDAAVAIACFDAERAQWDTRMTEALNALRAQLAPEDGAAGAPLDEPEAAATRAPGDDAAATDPVAAPESPAIDAGAALDTMQTAWTGWRDAACALDAAIYPGTAIADTARADCLMRLTARHAFHLLARLESAP